MESSPVRFFISPGDKIVDINGVDVTGLTTREITKVLKKTNDKERILGFISVDTNKDQEEGQSLFSEEVTEGDIVTNASM